MLPLAITSFRFTSDMKLSVLSAGRAKRPVEKIPRGCVPLLFGELSRYPSAQGSRNLNCAMIRPGHVF